MDHGQDTTVVDYYETDGYFSMLKYNVGQCESSSQKCHKCGYMNKRIKELSNREWGCMQCQIREMLIQYFHVPC